MMTESEQDFGDLYYRATQVFTPGAPINNKDFFWGRLKQIQRVVESIPSPGRHPIIFGQRGVGKTSLANIISGILPDLWSVKINCDGTDDFTSIWSRVLDRMSFEFKKKAFGFTDEEIVEKKSLKDLVGNKRRIVPSDVVTVLSIGSP